MYCCASSFGMTMPVAGRSRFRIPAAARCFHVLQIDPRGSGAKGRRERERSGRHSTMKWHATFCDKWPLSCRREAWKARLFRQDNVTAHSRRHRERSASSNSYGRQRTLRLNTIFTGKVQIAKTKIREWKLIKKEGCRSGASLFEGALGGEHGERTSFLGTPKDMLSKALEMGVCFHSCPDFGEHGWTLIS
jgi:hypothetical protein